MKSLRRVHRYLGVLFAPTILFFALSGILQTFGLHEAAPGSKVTPNRWIHAMASLHKDQRLKEHDADHGDAPPPPGAAVAAPRAAADGSPNSGHAAAKGNEDDDDRAFPAKVFVGFMGAGLIASTVLGLYMAYQNTRERWLTHALLAAGILLPVALLLL